MATIVTRSGKGSALTHTEMDNNITNLNTDKLETSGGTMSGAIAMGTNKITGLGDPTAAQDAATKAYVDTNAGGDVVDDTTPQLGGNLDVNGNDIVSTSNGDIELDPNGSGVVVFKGNSTKGAGQFQLNCEQNSHGIVIKGPPHSAAASYTLVLPDDDGSANQVLQTDGSGNLSFVDQTGGDVVDDTTPQLGGNLDVNGNSIVSTSNGDIAITPDGTGDTLVTNLKLADSFNTNNQTISAPTQLVFSSSKYLFRNTTNNNFLYESDTTGKGVILRAPTGMTADQAFTLPSTDGSSGQVLSTNGSGVLSFVANTGSGLSDVVDDTTPQLGGDLDVNGNSLTSTSNGDITLTPNGTGNVVLGNYEFDVDQTVGASQDNYVLTYDNSTGHISLEANTGGSGIANVVDDTTPQLGGNLDVNGNKIVSVSNGNIDIEPNGTGNVLLGNFTFDADQTVGASQDNFVLTYDNSTGLISLEAATGGGGGGDVVDDTTPQLGGNLDINGFDIVSAQTNQPIKISPSGTGAIELDTNNISIFGESDIARGTGYVIGHTDTLNPEYYSSSNKIGFVSNVRNSSFNANGRIYEMQHLTDLTFNNENTTVGGSNARARLGYDLTVVDLNGMTYGDSGSDRVGRGIIGHYQSTVINNSNTTYTGNAERVVGIDNQTYLSAGYDNEYNSVSSQNLVVENVSAYSARIGAETSSGAIKVQIEDSVAAYHTHSDSRDADNGNFQVASGAKFYNIKNDKPHYIEKFGSVGYYSELSYEATHSASGTFTVDYNNGNAQIITLEDNITSFTMSNFPGDNKSTGTPMIGAVTLYLKQDGTGSRTVSFTAGASETFKIANGITTVDSGAGNYTVVHVQNVDGTYLWTISGNYT